MIIQRLFSSRTKKTDDQIANTMTSAGKAGLVVSGGLAAGSAIQAGRAVVLVPKVTADAKEVMKLRKDKVVRNAVKKGIDDMAERVVILPGLGENLKRRIKNVESIYDNTKFSKLDRLSKMTSLGNTLSNQSRTVLGNMGNWAEDGARVFIKKTPGLTDQHKAVIDRGVRSMDRLGRFGLRVKNAKTLGRAAAAVGTISGAAYLHGRELQSYQAGMTRGGSVPLQ